MISVIRLTSGAELVGTVIDTREGTITVNNPLQIAYVARPGGAPSISLQRYIPFTSEEDITFNWDHVEAVCQPIQGLEGYYNNTLKLIKTHVDPSLVTDLMDAIEPKKEHPYETYIAMLERHMAKKPLN